MAASVCVCVLCAYAFVSAFMCLRVCVCQVCVLKNVCVTSGRKMLTKEENEDQEGRKAQTGAQCR